MQIDQNSSWLCEIEKEPKNFTCIQEICQKMFTHVRSVKNKADKEDLSQYIKEKEEAHASGAVERAYDLYPKGAQLKPNSQVVVVKENLALGKVGDNWTKYHPEWRPTKARRFIDSRIERNDEGCQVDDNYVEWKEVKKFQQEMTR
ncbi:8483_t:CDS:2 [Paraglomus occultum]|uniref:8483_t:CDS:1 n=1 Tax=Paraglomus occultum TaxID=144539 RepID=A0A9N9BZB5_9GLOM|nr:8483_t:CDS:2 [Paraglomus occultum]